MALHVGHSVVERDCLVVYSCGVAIDRLVTVVLFGASTLPLGKLTFVGIHGVIHDGRERLK